MKISNRATDHILKEYTLIHARQDKAMMIGEQILYWCWHIQDLTNKYPGTRMLDFGCGKAYAYLNRRVYTLWDIEKVILHDIGIQKYSKRPEQNEFQSVVSIDVLEHIPEDLIDETFKYWYHNNTQFVFATIASYPARATLSDGSNAHVTIKPKEWWEEKIRKYQTCYTEIIYLDRPGSWEKLVFEK